MFLKWELCLHKSNIAAEASCQGFLDRNVSVLLVEFKQVGYGIEANVQINFICQLVSCMC